jgi:flagellar basal-body rod modification protein FlgD
MTTVGSTTSASSATASGITSSTSGMIASTFDQFLQLLMTQMTHQNPLDPMDANQFTQQLVQFASVEQQLKSNQTLDSLLQASQASTTTSALGFVGMQVTADGASAPLASGTAQWQLTSPRASTAAISIKDSTGKEVWTGTRTLTAGTQTFAWDGKSNSGTVLPDGSYTISVTGKDAANAALAISTDFVGTVDGVDFSGGSTVLKIGSISVPMANVKSIRRPL